MWYRHNLPPPYTNHHGIFRTALSFGIIDSCVCLRSRSNAENSPKITQLQQLLLLTTNNKIPNHAIFNLFHYRLFVICIGYPSTKHFPLSAIIGDYGNSKRKALSHNSPLHYPSRRSSHHRRSYCHFHYHLHLLFLFLSFPPPFPVSPAIAQVGVLSTTHSEQDPSFL